jgi:hypothetical protein
MQSGMNRALIAVASLLLVMSGCRPAGQPNQRNVTINGATNVGPGGSGPIDTDACAARLQNIIGQLYAYYLANHRYPDRLDELAKYADFDQVPDYKCPVSHQPYSYAPNGLESVNASGRLIVYDSAPVHQNARWGIVVRPPPRGQQTMTMEVVEIPEGLFQTYVPVRIVPQLPPTTAPSGAAGR